MRSDYQSRCFALCLGFFGGFVLSGCELVEGVATVGWETAKFTGKAIKSAAYLAQGKHRVRLKKVGNSLFADVTLNRKTHAQFLVDTGASNVMLSQRTAKLMVFKLVSAAAKTWRRLKGENQLPKVVRGVKFQNGVEVIEMPANHAA